MFATAAVTTSGSIAVSGTRRSRSQYAGRENMTNATKKKPGLPTRLSTVHTARNKKYAAMLIARKTLK